MASTRAVDGGVVASAAVALAAILMLAVTDLSPALGSIEWRAVATARAVPLKRLYVPLETADGTVTSLGGTNGHVRIASLFYTHCPLMCPLTIAAIRDLDRELTRDERARLRVLLVSLDPVRDAPAALAGMRAQQALQGARWVLARTAPELLPSIATAFGVTVTATAGGGIEHSPAVLLLDENGAVLARSGNVSGDARFLAAVRSALGTHGS